MFRITELRYKRLHDCTVVEKKVWIPERFFDNHYKGRHGIIRQKAKNLQLMLYRQIELCYWKQFLKDLT